MIARPIVAAVLLLSTSAQVASANNGRGNGGNSTPPASSGPSVNSNGGGGNGNKKEKGASSLSCAPFLATFFVNVSPTACAGFYIGNANTGSDKNADAEVAVRSLLGDNTATLTNLQQLEGGSTGKPFIDFTRPLIGTTIIGIHWGNGVFGKFKDLPGFEKTQVPDGENLGTAFFKFNAGASLDQIEVAKFWQTSLSNAALYYTGEPCRTNCGGGPDGNPVPEPASAALVGAGLLALGAAARRRRQKS